MGILKTTDVYDLIILEKVFLSLIVCHCCLQCYVIYIYIFLHQTQMNMSTVWLKLGPVGEENTDNHETYF